MLFTDAASLADTAPRKRRAEGCRDRSTERTQGNMSKRKHYFTKKEYILWICSVSSILLVHVLGAGEWTATAAALIGVTSLLLCAKGNPAGQALMLVFSALYGMISFERAYYGEMITYLGMTAPMALFSLIAWIRNPYEKGKAEVSVRRVGRWEWGILLLLSGCVTVVFYFILRAVHTAELPLSTLSVFTSFLAASLTFRRSTFCTLAYALNDVVLIALWALAAASHTSAVSVLVCFIVFLANDLYGFYSWRRMERRQATRYTQGQLMQDLSEYPDETRKSEASCISRSP